MAKELVLNRMLDFKRFVTTNKRLPKVWEIKFLDKEDMRLWFDTILKLPNFQNFVTEINEILQANGKKILTDLEKEQEFLNYILKYNKIPQNNEAYFSDESEMLTWYRFYRIKHPQYEEQVHHSLYEYQDFDINLIWPRIKDEFLSIIKKFKWKKL